MSLEIRRALAEDIPRAQRFYADRQYHGGIGSEDTLLVAERDGELVGVVRLASENGVIVLRGMQVQPDVQRQGIGTRLLAAVAQMLQERPCFCIPYAHLVNFYRGIGFEVIESEAAPNFLRLRLQGYQNRGDGKEYLIMCRAARS